MTLPMNLQLFAAGDADETDENQINLIEPDEEETQLDSAAEAETEDDESQEDEAESEEDEADEEDLEDDALKTKKRVQVEPDDTTPWVKKRLLRAERSFERKMLEDAASLSDGVTVGREDLPKAVRLWNVLKYNRELSDQVNEILNRATEGGTLRTLADVRPESKADELSSRFELKEAELELKYSDPVFKKYESQIRDWAEDEGLELSNAKSLKMALRAWKGENSAILAAAPTKKAQAKAVQQAQARQKASLAGGRSSGKNTQMDYKKSSDKDILSNLGLNLFTEE